MKRTRAAADAPESPSVSEGANGLTKTETGLGEAASLPSAAEREQLMRDAANALAKPTPVIFTTHSDAAAMRCEAECKALNQLVAEIDSKIALLEAEREDLMLAYSMQSHALVAKQKGAR